MRSDIKMKVIVAEYPKHLCRIKYAIYRYDIFDSQVKNQLRTQRLAEKFLF